MLSFTCEALVACPPFSPWNLPSFTVDSTLPTPCSRSYFPLSRQGAALTHLDSLLPHDLVLWTDGCVFFLLAKAAPAYSPTALSVALRPLFPFQQAQHVQVFLLKPAPFCTLFAGLGSTNKPAISLLLLSDSRSVLATLSSPPSFLLSQTLWQELSSLSSCSIRLQWVPGHSFLPWNDAAVSWPDGERCLRPLQSLVVSFLISLVSTLVLSWTGGVLSHLNFLTRRFPRYPSRNLCSLVMLAVFSFVYAATDTAFC